MEGEGGGGKRTIPDPYLSTPVAEPLPDPPSWSTRGRSETLQGAERNASEPAQTGYNPEREEES